MVRKYLAIHSRRLCKNRLYSFVGIAGMSVGLMCSILILLWINAALSWDGFHTKKDRLYRVCLQGSVDGETRMQMGVPLPLWGTLGKLTGIENVVPTSWQKQFILSYGDKRISKTGYYAGDAFLEIFTFPMVAGTADQPLKDPSSIVITAATAKALFGETSALGKTIRVDDTVDLMVSGIVNDVPHNSTFQFECLLPFAVYLNREPWVKQSLNRWNNNSFHLYAALEPGADARAIARKLKGIIKKHNVVSTQEVTFTNMNRWHLYADFTDGATASERIVHVWMFAIIAVFIMALVYLNFINIAIANVVRLAGAVNIRESTGSQRKLLIVQCTGEPLFMAFLIFILALVLLEACLPFFNSLVNETLSIHYTSMLFWLASSGVMIAPALASGCYASFHLSFLRSAHVLQESVQAGEAENLPGNIKAPRHMITF